MSIVLISLSESTKPLSFSDSDKFFPLGMRTSEGRPGILYFFCRLSVCLISLCFSLVVFDFLIVSLSVFSFLFMLF